MTIFDVLKDDHKKMRSILEQIEKTSEDKATKRQALVDELWDEVIPHARAEEKVLYETLKDIDAARHISLKAYEEHNVVEGLLRELSLLDPSGERFAAKFGVLKENLEHHIEEEEQSVFESAKAVLAPEECQAMGQYFKQIRQEVADGSIVQVTLETPKHQDIVGTDVV